MSDNIVGDWLKTIELERYTPAFLDNGYDELEVCKQIGDPDLDAIGVTKGPHRKKILQAVVKLKEEGGTSVYFTLESQENESAPEEKSPDTTKKRVSHGSTAGQSRTPDESAKNPAGARTEAQLTDLVRNKVIKDGINLLSTPYTRRVSHNK